MADYVPFTSAPFPTRPDSVMTGIDMGLQDLAIRRAQELAMQDTQSQTAYREAQRARYEGMTPNELIKSNLEGKSAQLEMDTPGALEQLLRGRLGEAQTKQARGEFDTQTNTGKISAENSANQLKVLENTQQYIDQHSNLIRAAEASGGPGAAQMAYNKMLEGLGKHADEFPKEWNPRTAAGLEELRKRMADSVAQRQKLEDQRLKNEGNLDVAKEHSRGQIAAAQVRASMNKNDYVQILSKTPIQNKLSVIAALELRGDLSPSDLASLKAIALGEIATAYGVKLPPQLPGMPASEIQAFLSKNLRNYAAPQTATVAPTQGLGTNQTRGPIGDGTTTSPIKLR